MEVGLPERTDSMFGCEAPLISVIVPSFNHEKYLSNCIESVVRQTYENVELIVIDDGSTDGSDAVLQGLQKTYGFHYIRQDNLGLPATLNKAVSIAKGKYISLLASDDEFLVSKLDILAQLLEGHDDTYAVAFGDAEFVNEDGLGITQENAGNNYCNFIDYYLSWQSGHEKLARLGTYESLIRGNHIPAMSALIRRDALSDVGIFDEDIAVEDWNIWLKLSKEYKFAFYSGVVARYRLHGLNTVSTMTGILAGHTLRMLQREKEYCQEKGYTASWKYSYHSTLISYCKHCGLRPFLKEMNFADYPEFVWFVIVNICKLGVSRLKYLCAAQ